MPTKTQMDASKVMKWAQEHKKGKSKAALGAAMKKGWKMVKAGKL